MSALEQRVLELVDQERDELVAFYRELVQIPSIWGHAEPLARAADLIDSALRDAGMETEQLDSGTDGMSMVLARMKRDGGRSLLFNGHMEVYPPSESWSLDPFGGTIRDGRLYGQGAADMKAGTAAMTVACRLLAKHDVPLAGELMLLAIPNHFEGGEGTRAALRGGVSADAAIVCEPTSLRVVHGQRGILYLTITTHGRAAHTTATDIGVNAIVRMAKVIDALERMEMRDATGEVVRAQKLLNAAMIDGGLAHNLIPERCALTVDIRFPPEQTQDDVLRDVRRAIAEALPPDEFATDVVPEDTCVRNPRSSLYLPQDHPLVRRLAAAHERATGRPAAYGMHPAWPDTPAINELGVPAITYGPGSWDCYWDDESVALDEYVDAVRTYCVMAVRMLCGEEG